MNNKTWEEKLDIGLEAEFTSGKRLAVDVCKAFIKSNFIEKEALVLLIAEFEYHKDEIHCSCLNGLKHRLGLSD